jgi:ABC-type antimicrobial peptide transport system permease subunit
MSARVEDAIGQTRFVVRLLGLFALLGVLLACLGLYSLMAQDVARRRREIAIRVALGAPKGQVIAALLGRAGLLVSAGLSIGLVGALAASRLLVGLLHGVSAADAGAYALAAPLLAATALAAAFIPAQRAARVDPASALRGEP